MRFHVGLFAQASAALAHFVLKQHTSRHSDVVLVCRGVREQSQIKISFCPLGPRAIGCECKGIITHELTSTGSLAGVRSHSVKDPSQGAIEMFFSFNIFSFFFKHLYKYSGA